MKLAGLFDEPEVRLVIEQSQIKAQDRIRKLTYRQRQVLKLMVEGQPNKIIAYELGIAQRSVENHRAEIMRRTEVKSFAALVKLYVLAG